MSEHEKETAFLRRLMALDSGAQGRQLEARLAAAERNDRVVRQAILAVSLLLGLSVVGLGYSAILLPDFPFNRSQFILKLFLALGLGSGLCLVAYTCMWVRCRRSLNRLRDECRRTLETTLQTRLRTAHDGPAAVAVKGPSWPLYQNETLATVDSLPPAA